MLGSQSDLWTLITHLSDENYSMLVVLGSGQQKWLNEQLAHNSKRLTHQLVALLPIIKKSGFLFNRKRCSPLHSRATQKGSFKEKKKKKPNSNLIAGKLQFIWIRMQSSNCNKGGLRKTTQGLSLGREQELTLIGYRWIFVGLWLLEAKHSIKAFRNNNKTR